MSLSNTDTNSDESTPRKRLPWDADNASPDGPTSLDILLKWITTPGKYEQLHSEKRRRAVENIIALLKKYGILHRSESSIRSKVRFIEQQYLTAEDWMDEMNISCVDLEDGHLDDQTEEELLAKCPHYHEVVPVFRHSSYLNKMMVSLKYAEHERGDTTDSDKSNATSVKRKRKNEKRARRSIKQHQKTEPEVQSHAGVHEKESGSPGTPIVMNCFQRTTTHGAMHNGVLDLTGPRDWYQLAGKREAASGIQRDVNDIKLNHLKKQSEAVLKSENSMREAVMMTDIEAKRSRDQVQLQLDKVMARQTMKIGGVPDDEVERAIPLPQLEKE